jgi:hypothetical protein
MAKQTKHEAESVGYVTFDRSGVTVDIVRYFKSARGKETIARLKEEQKRLQDVMSQSSSNKPA